MRNTATFSILYRSTSNRGVALFLVLAFLALIITLVLAFFSSVTSELTAARSSASEVTAKQLGETAVQVVSSVIRMATSSSGNNVAWASQPGMIRTYGTSGGSASSAPLAYFKLYSSEDMEVTQSEIASYDMAGDVDGLWDTKPAVFTDLNSPVVDTKGKPRFPIIDPRVQTAPGTGQVDGFSYSNAMQLSSGGTTTINQTVLTGGDTQRLPMPVKWIYVLRDGTLSAPRGVDGTGKIANWTGETNVAKKPSLTNPIVGRIAFWTDDESCKVNINTASEGTFWDVPRIYSDEDFGRYSGSSVSVPGMAVCQPAQKEYQRYPGHPATTSLSPIFKSLLPVTTPYPANPTATDATKLDAYYNITPRIGLNSLSGGGSGGSKGGSYQVPNNAPVLVTDTDRLYASVDELMFTPLRTPNGSGTFSKEELEKRKFFLTASSSAPETTLFNTPRIAIWPVNASLTKRTAYDKLLAFCSTIGGKSYYFTRSNPRSSTEDYETSLRNKELYGYLQNKTSSNIPGFGGNFSTKYAADRNQILTYIYDYIRCTNLQDQSAGSTPYTAIYPNLGAGEVVPIRIAQTQGFGRFLSVSSANLLFYGTHSDATGKIDKMRAVFFLQFASPMHGMAAKRSATKYVVTGLEKLKAKIGPGTISLNFEPGGINRMTVSDLSIYHGRDVGGTEHALQAIRKSDRKIWDDASAGVDCKPTNIYPFFSKTDIIVPAGQTTFSFPSAVDVKVEISPDETAAGSSVIQTINLKFPDGTFKLPGIKSPPDHNFGARDFSSFEGVTAFPNSNDTIISLQVAGAAGNDPANADDPTAGDNRLVESLMDVPSERFRAHNNYRNAGVQFAHGLTMSTGERCNQGIYGTLVANANYQNPRNWRQPDVPSRVPANKGVTRKDGGPGDWDTGFGDQTDGAYINKPDEGDTALQDQIGATRLPYMLGYGKGTAAATNTYFSPNRQIPSPLIFGSIPTGVQRVLPWQTLLFHPRPEDPSHPGNLSPKDHLLADLFWMPVIEPYAISQPFATSGKINLNYQIMPFTYVKRSTGLHAVMKSTKFMALRVEDAPIYKPRDYSDHAPIAPNRRRTIDMTKTLADFDAKFKNNDLFKSVSQICEMNLVPPEVANSAAMAAFWNENPLTGDNLREKPYVDIYPRLTTKSNAYTVHFRVQVLKKSRSSGVAEWDETKDAMLSEYRGSSIIERYVDASDTSLPDFASSTNTKSLDAYYKFRVLSTKKF